eukprot:CAMPEP_0206430586 /NCGR_PEP_ID=MMETSP0324_2-20121206/6897_1 /ASSEMBLY_ACC=CAM_ASM_000836 /TAXON_ID=2866 /ORGANISM="Crypthecodinium cohnii, Strain Seligo" /LENGTH=110 /DNA_ID=CAMNT_0053896431 /DNA_START=687 /DNA_END=1019 /DNA_ORIENTATION=+
MTSTPNFSAWPFQERAWVSPFGERTESRMSSPVRFIKLCPWRRRKTFLGPSSESEPSGLSSKVLRLLRPRPIGKSWPQKERQQERREEEDEEDEEETSQSMQGEEEQSSV